VVKDSSLFKIYAFGNTNREAVDDLIRGLQSVALHFGEGRELARCIR
jgi:hypothetical protein